MPSRPRNPKRPFLHQTLPHEYIGNHTMPESYHQYQHQHQNISSRSISPLTTPPWSHQTHETQHLETEAQQQQLYATHRQMLLLCSILRLRFQPTIPYILIASIFLNRFPFETEEWYHASTVSIPSTTPSASLTHHNNNNPSINTTAFTFPYIPLFSSSSKPHESIIQSWLTQELERESTFAAKHNTESFIEAVTCDDITVKEVFEELALSQFGFEIKSKQEVELGVKWLRSGDWRAGSEPLIWDFNGDDESTVRRWGVIGEGRPGKENKHCDDDEREKRDLGRSGEEMSFCRNGDVDDTGLLFLEEILACQKRVERKRNGEGSNENLMKRFDGLSLVAEKFKMTSQNGGFESFSSEDFEMSQLEDNSQQQVDNHASVNNACTKAAGIKLKLDPTTPIFQPSAPAFNTISTKDKKLTSPSLTPQVPDPSSSLKHEINITPSPHHKILLPNDPIYTLDLPKPHIPTSNISDSHSHPTKSQLTTTNDEITIEYDPATLIDFDAKKTTCAMRLRSNWYGYGNQIDEIREYERMLKARNGEGR